MKHRNTLWIVTVVALVSATSAACGGGADTSTQAPSTPAPAASPTPAATPTLSASQHMDRGMDHYDQGQLDEAIAEFKQAIRLDPSSVEAHYNLGLAYNGQGKSDEAVASFEEAIQLDPDLAEPHNGLGNAYRDQGRLEEALAEYEEAVRLDPNLADAHFNLGHTYLDLERFAEALSAYQEAARFNPDDAEIHHNIGVAYVKQGMVEHAISAWEKAARLNPDSAETQYVLGVAYFDQEMFEEAISTLNEALRLDPERDGAHKYLGGAHYALGHDEQAIVAFQTYLSLQPDDPHRESIEGMLAELQGAAVGPGPTIEYSNAEGGYTLLYPKDLHYDEDHEWAVFAESQAALDTAFDYRVGDAIKESPVVMFDALALAEMAKDFDVEETASPTEFLQAMVKSLEAETGEIQPGEVDDHPAALAEISGIYEETRYRGALAIVIVEDRVVGASTMALPDQWEVFRPTFIAMLNSLHFIDPQE